mmetsp:Transcript_8271/g.18484  ORF Transcript_8271/g.18484 Transcript_8271/m.18484 type:complete len:228 (+) Transcript_8271:49-732(+)
MCQSYCLSAGHDAQHLLLSSKPRGCPVVCGLPAALRRRPQLHGWQLWMNLSPCCVFQPLRTLWLSSALGVHSLHPDALDCNSCRTGSSQPGRKDPNDCSPAWREHFQQWQPLLRPLYRRHLPPPSRFRSPSRSQTRNTPLCHHRPCQSRRCCSQTRTDLVKVPCHRSRWYTGCCDRCCHLRPPWRHLASRSLAAIQVSASPPRSLREGTRLHPRHHLHQHPRGLGMR